MKPIKPRYTDTVKLDMRISRRSKQLLNLYSKYTRYDEEFILEKLISEILEDEDFMKWLNDKRYQKRIQTLVLDIKEQSNNDILGTKEEELSF